MSERGARSAGHRVPRVSLVRTIERLKRAVAEMEPSFNDATTKEIKHDLNAIRRWLALPEER